jgi:tetratricopeptide (TPR) repeat protein
MISSTPRRGLAQSAATAYRADLGSREQPFGGVDGEWITVAAVLEHAALVGEPERTQLLRNAVTLATRLVGDAEVRRLAEREWQDRDRSESEAIVILADRIEAAGAFMLAGSVLDALLEADASLSSVQYGRVLARRARLEWKAGRLDNAADRYAYLESLGRRSKSAELRARASIGFVALNQIRQNATDMHRYAKRAARLAEQVGLRRLTRDAHGGLAIAAALDLRIDDALVHGWTVYQLSLGDPLDEAEVLQNLGQMLFVSGFVDVARAAFASVVSRELPARWMLPALGSLALASAASKHDHTTEWAARELLRIDPPTVPRYPLASALSEAATALTRIGRSKAALRCKEAALELARQYDFSMLVAELEGLDGSSPAPSVSPTTMLNKRAANIARELSSMEPTEMPQHIAFAVASA